MPTERIDSHKYRVLLSGGLKCLEEKCDQINKLNVFPVPDGDTGDNMMMTLQSGLAETVADADIGLLCNALSKGMLYGARGNSGVILSRFFYGVNRHLSDCKEMISPSDLTAGFEVGVAEAYAAVSSPKEGTILTVMRETTDALKESGPDDFESFFKTANFEASESLKRTPEQLEVLKSAGVVDSGGAGFLCILEGMKNALEGGTIYSVGSAKAAIRELTGDEEMLGYCTEFILQLMREETFSLEAFKGFLDSIGNSVVAFQNDNIVKVHVHTFRPEEVLRAAHGYGEFLTLKIENMTVMHSESTVENEFSIPTQKSKYGLVAVACGDGVKQMLASGGCTVVDGGRSMNPSAQDILTGVKEANAETVFVFPNHKNVFLAASQAKEMCDFCKVIVIASEDIGHCYQAISFFDPESSADELTNLFASARDLGKTVQVARASRSCTEGDLDVEEGDWLCFDHDRILVAAKDENEAILTFFDRQADCPDLAILLFGEDESEDAASALAEQLSERFPDTEFIATHGGQPIYHYTLIVR